MEIVPDTHFPNNGRVPRMGIRKWIAWKLAILSAKFYDGEHIETLTFRDETGQVRLEIEVIGDEWGCGISSWNGHGGGLPEGWSEDWSNETWPEWWEREGVEVDG